MNAKYFLIFATIYTVHCSLNYDNQFRLDQQYYGSSPMIPEYYDYPLILFKNKQTVSGYMGWHFCNIIFYICACIIPPKFQIWASKWMKNLLGSSGRTNHFPKLQSSPKCVFATIVLVWFHLFINAIIASFR